MTISQMPAILLATFRYEVVRRRPPSRPTAPSLRQRQPGFDETVP